MAGPPTSRVIGDLTFQEVGTALRESSILCLPMGSMEQHGPHLPLNTDAVLVEAFTGRMVERWASSTISGGCRRSRSGCRASTSGAAGTLSLSVGGMTAVLRDLCREIVRALPVRNLLIVNGHGGNRGMLEALGRELHGDFGLNLCALHLGAMISPVTDAAVPEIHAGKDETSVMLALAPERVRRELMPGLKAPPGGDAIRATILDPATSWPWSSGDRRIAVAGVIGDAGSASAELGNAIVARVVDATGAVLKQLLANHAGR